MAGGGAMGFGERAARKRKGIGGTMGRLVSGAVACWHRAKMDDYRPAIPHSSALCAFASLRQIPALAPEKLTAAAAASIISPRYANIYTNAKSKEGVARWRP